MISEAFHRPRDRDPAPLNTPKRLPRDVPRETSPSLIPSCAPPSLTSDPHAYSGDLDIPRYRLISACIVLRSSLRAPLRRGRRRLILGVQGFPAAAVALYPLIRSQNQGVQSTLVIRRNPLCPLGFRLSLVRTVCGRFSSSRGPNADQVGVLGEPFAGGPCSAGAVVPCSTDSGLGTSHTEWSCLNSHQNPHPSQG